MLDEKKKVLAVDVDKAGDFSTYTLRLVKKDQTDEPPKNFDPILSARPRYVAPLRVAMRTASTGVNPASTSSSSSR